MNDGNRTDKAMPCLYNIIPLSEHRIPNTEPITDYRLPITDYRIPITNKNTCHEFET